MHLRDPDERVVHSLEALERFVETAAARGVDEIGFTEHVYYFRQTRAVWSLPYQLERCVYDLDEYVGHDRRGEAAGPPGRVRARGRLRRRTAGRARRRARALPMGLPARLGALARRPRRRPGAGHLGACSVDEVWRRYFAALAELAASGHVDVLAHPDLPKIFGRRPEGGIEYPALDGRRARDLDERAATSRSASCIRTLRSSRPRGFRSRSPRTRTSLRTSAATSTAPSSMRVRQAMRR